ncbi:MAG: phosphopyruvate hydratase [Acidobacteriota bacterium]
MIIEDLKAREILDSRGNPTLEVEVRAEFDVYAIASVPSGASTGTYEALELRDNDPSRYGGKGVKVAVDNVNNKIAPEIIDEDFSGLRELDSFLISLDNTKNKSKLGANAIVGVSMAVAKAFSLFYRIPLYNFLGGFNAHILPIPMMNILNGGVHADNNLDIQEFMIVPLGFKSFKEALRAGVEIFHTLKNTLKTKNLSTSVGDEGGFSPSLKSHEEALDLIAESVEKAKYKLGKEVFLAIDAAASEFHENGKYVFKKGDGSARTSEGMVEYYADLVDKYPLISIEDGLAEDDWEGWRDLTKRLGKKIMIVGDDLFVTNPNRLKEGIEKESANAILIKLNQIGTVSETADAVEMAKNSKFLTIISHRSGETDDPFIADFSVGMNSYFIKTGSVCRGERISKYNRLLKIEEELGKIAVYAGQILKI